MFGITRIAIASVAALATAGTGSAVLVSAAPPTTVEAGAELSARADADLRAAQEAHDQLMGALSSADAGAKAGAEVLIDASTTKLEQASASMKAAVEAGSTTAIDGIASFTERSTRLVNSLAATAAVTADASAQAGARLAKAVDDQLAAVSGLAGAQGTAALKALSDTKLSLPHLSAPATSANVGVSAGAQAGNGASAPSANVVGSATGQFGITLGR